MATYLVQRAQRSLLRPTGPMQVNWDRARELNLCLWYPLREHCNDVINGVVSTVITGSQVGAGPEYGGLVRRQTTGTNSVRPPSAAYSRINISEGFCSIWVRCESLTGFQMAIELRTLGIEIGDGHGNSSIFLRFTYPGASISGTSLVVGELAQLTASWSQSQNLAVFWKNGVRIGSDTSLSAPSAISDMYLGSDVFSQEWLGTLNDAIFGTRPISDGEAWALYDPATRWDLYAVPSHRIVFNVDTIVSPDLVVPSSRFVYQLRRDVFRRRVA